MKVVGKVNSREMYQHNIEAHQLARSLNLRSFLIDLTESVNVNSAAENYDFVYRQVRNSPEMLHKVCLALLLKKNDHSHDFIETLASNAGEKVKKFYDVEEAVRFLIES